MRLREAAAVRGAHRQGLAPAHPDAVLHTNDREVYAAFVRGLFEADGTTSNGYVSWSTTTESFSRDVQSLLLALGFVTTRKVDVPKSNWGMNDRFVLRLLNVASAERYLEEIDFMSVRKAASLWTGDHRQASRADHIPVSRELARRARARERLAAQDDADGARPPRRRLAPLGDAAPRAHRRPGARAPARLLLRRGRDRRDARRPADLRPLGARQRHLRGQRLRQPQHHQLHDGLRHDRGRARLLARQVEEARRRRRDHDPEQDRADGPREAGLRAARGRGDRRVRRRAQHRRSARRT